MVSCMAVPITQVQRLAFGPPGLDAEGGDVLISMIRAQPAHRSIVRQRLEVRLTKRRQQEPLVPVDYCHNL